MRHVAIVLSVLLLAARAAAQPCTGDVPASDRYCGVSLVSGLGGPNDFGTRCLSPNDDGSSALIDLTPAFPAGIRFFGRTHTAMFVNTNGNISFGAEVGTYTPEAFPIADQPMIAPYWADVDIRGDDGMDGCVSDGFEGSDWTTCMIPPGGDNGVYWHLEPGRVVVTWDRVGYFSCSDERNMSFQLILTGAGGCGGGDFDVEFRYAQCEWTTGDASGGEGGLARSSTPCTTDFDCSFGFGEETCMGGVCYGVAGQIGFDAGNLTDYVVIAGSRTDDVDRVACEESNVGMPGIYQFQIRGGTVVCPDAGTPCDTGRPGVCDEGREQCVGGGTECRPVVPPSAERCDALDNDCDGMVDDGDEICGTLGVCVRGTCVDRCFEGGCPGDLVCAASMQCLEPGCEDVVCGEGERCSAGTCVEACDGVVCPDGETCLAGRCLDLCATLECDDCTVCEDGACVARCSSTSCASGETCTAEGRCVATDCASVTCPSGRTCRAGTCVDRCDGVVCPRGEECRAGGCETTRVLPDAGMPRADGGASSDDAGSGTGDGGPIAMIDAGPPCRDPSCLPDSPRRSCACSAPGTGGSTAAGAALSLLALALAGARRRR